MVGESVTGISGVMSGRVSSTCYARSEVIQHANASRDGPVKYDQMLGFAEAPGERAPSQAGDCSLESRIVSVGKGSDKRNAARSETRRRHQIEQRSASRFSNFTGTGDRLDENDQGFRRAKVHKYRVRQ